ncbi:MFS transporter [Caulobacter sp. KR2-114]|uniref:MFS transporter n=1 Tax=Caulobacter sp. KR2-114 TaxID=3400912 RepID=UPI003C013989
MELTFDRADEAASDDRWIGARPSPLAIAALLATGVVGMEIAGVQPVLLGALVAEHRLTAAGLGWATTAEFLTLGVGISLAGAFLKPQRLKLLAALAAVGVLVADLLAIGQSGAAIIINRGLCGFGEGLMVWLSVCMIARSSTPARWSGIFLTLQGIAQLAFTAILPLTLMDRYGANGGFAVLAGTAALALVAAPFIPSSFVDLPGNDQRGVSAVFASPRALGSLVSVFLVAAFSIGLFAYMAPLAEQAHLDPKVLGFAVSGVLATSIVGSTAAAAAAKRISYYPVFLACAVVNVVVLALLAAPHGAVVFIAATGVFGFFWLFFLPFQLPLAIEADPSRRIAVVLPGAQLFGGAAGPFLCSLFVTDTDAHGALLVCGVCFLVAFGLSTVLHMSHRRAARAEAALARG